MVRNRLGTATGRLGVPLFLAMLLTGLAERSSQAQQLRSAGDRVYSSAQASRGQAVYDASCASCHGAALQGGNAPPLAGDGFLDLWGKDPLSDLVGKIQKTMPASKPGTLTLQQATDIVAYLLQVGKFPAGQAELGANEATLKLLSVSGSPKSSAPVAPVSSHASVFPPGGNLAQVMRGILFPTSNLIFNVQSQDPSQWKAPAVGGGAGGGISWTDWGAGIYSPWEMVDYAAVAVADSAALMLTPGRRCENGKPVPVDDPRWIAFSQEMFDAGLATYKASQTRNQEAVSDATNQLADSCLHCHQVYRDHPRPRGGAAPDRSTRCTPR